MKIRELAQQGRLGKLLKLIFILLTIVLIGNLIFVNTIAILPGTIITSTIIIIIIVTFTVVKLIKNHHQNYHLDCHHHILRRGPSVEFTASTGSSKGPYASILPQKVI